MRKILSAISICFFALPLFSQQGPLLQNFKYRINRFRAINYNINGGSQFEQYDWTPGNVKSSGTNGNIGAGYFFTKSTDRILLTANAGLYSSVATGKSISQSVERTNRNFNVSPSINVLNKWFAKNHFTELGAVASYNYGRSKNRQLTPANKEKSYQDYYSVAIQTGIGKGRLENVTNMQNGLWLYKELQEANLLTRSLSDVELNELGQSITDGTNTRVLDTRRRTQFILKTVDNYFQQKGLVAKTDINYFTRLNDILFFAVNNQRLSGIEKFIRFTPAIQRNNDESNVNNFADKYRQTFRRQSLVLTTGFNKYKPASLTHQNNYGASVKMAYNDYTFNTRNFIGGVNNTVETIRTIKQAGANVFFQHAIYPNTRTVILFDLQSEGGYQENQDQSEFYTSTAISGTMNYFLSYRTMLRCTIGTSYEKNAYYVSPNYSQPERLYLNANVGLDINL